MSTKGVAEPPGAEPPGAERPVAEPPAGPGAAWARVWTALRRPHGSRRSLAWRIAVPVACACAGLLATTSMVNARGTDLRGGPSAELIDIVAAQRAEAEQLNSHIDQVQQEVTTLSEQVGGSRLRGLESRIDELAVSAGMTALEGPGLTVSLDDAPLDQELPDGVSTNRLVVHQQDIQAVVNALWAGGAEGMTLQGQRIISTTGIKCVGNTVLLQGVPYAPPYVVVAVGDSDRMSDALFASDDVLRYRSDAATLGLGWSFERLSSVRLPAYEGTPDLEYARPAGDTDD
jgi:uncharacterized protein YlxW (UPF0749 family)